MGTSTGEAIHIFQTARSSPCTASGMSLQYFHNGGALALEVEVSPTLIAATASGNFYVMLSEAGLTDMIGTHSRSEFRAKMCRAQGKHFFPYACDFLAPQHLGSLCSSLTQLLAVSAQ